MKGLCRSNSHYPCLWLPGRVCSHARTAPPLLPERAQALRSSGTRSACRVLGSKEGGRATALWAAELPLSALLCLRLLSQGQTGRTGPPMLSV